MKPMDVEITEDGTTQQSPCVFPLPFATDYQEEALETAMKQNTIVFLETGSGKTLIAVMLLQSYAHLLKKPSPFFAVFLVPTVRLVQQQSEVLLKHTDLKVGKYRGGKGINFQHPASWSKELDENEVLVMTPEILLAALRHSCLKMEMIKVLIFDECHNARGKHPYACIMMEFYHQKMNSENSNLPQILGMTASPIKAKDCSSESDYWQQIHDLEILMHSKIYTCSSESALAEYKFYEHRDIPMFKVLGNEFKLVRIKSPMHTSVPFTPLDCLPVEPFYKVEATGAVVNLSSCVPLLDFYCSKLPSDGYCKLIPNIVIDKDSQTCTLDLPRDCPIQTVVVKDNLKQLKQLPYLEACKRHHHIGALTDHLLPEIVEQEKEAQQIDSFEKYTVEQVKYVPPELVACASNDSRILYHCYLIELEPDFNSNIKPQNLMLALRTRPEFDDETLSFDLDDNNGNLKITLRYHSVIELSPEKVFGCQKFQVTILRFLIDHKLNMSRGFLDEFSPSRESAVFDYLLLPSTGSHQDPFIDWECASSVEAVEQPLLTGKRVFSVQNYLHRGRSHNATEARKAAVELPPELCKVVMSPISVALLYSFSLAPSIMHRIESLLLAATLKRMLVDHCVQKDVIPTAKILEAITTKHCQENFHNKTLATLGDSFLKYVIISQQLFKTNQNDHQGLLTTKRKKIVSNVPLSKLGCDNKILGFIRDEPFDPKTWVMPGDNIETYTLEGDFAFYYIGKMSRTRKIKSKIVADVVEALIGSFLDLGGDLAALSFMEWLGIKADLTCHGPHCTMPLQLNPEKLVNVQFFESLLNYKFQDTSLLVEALTHGSFKRPEIPTSYKRLEFLGDAVLDHVVTKCLYYDNPGLTPGLLTDLRSVSVNNDCYAQFAIKARLHEHILHNSQELKRQIDISVGEFENSSCCGWESEIIFPEILGDIVESIAGAVFVDSGYNKETVFQSMRPLFLEPMVTPETLKLHPVRELKEFCDKRHFKMKKAIGKTSTLEIIADGVTIYRHSRSASNQDMAERLVSKDVLKWLKEKYMSSTT